MTECSRCGDCCDPVFYPLGGADLRQSALVATGGPHAEDLAFAAAHWRPTGELRGGLYAYACDRFDPVSRLCTAHDERPPICRGYPHYEREYGSPLTLGLPVLPERCAFRADLPLRAASVAAARKTAPVDTTRAI